MPRYYFNYRSGEKSEPYLDDEGIDLPDLSAAREEAIGGARDIAADRVRSGHPWILMHLLRLPMVTAIRCSRSRFVKLW